MNETSENLLNISSIKATGKKLSKYFRSEIVSICNKAIAQERIIHEQEVNFTTLLNTFVKIDITVSPYYLSEGILSGLILQIKDKDKIDFLTKLNRQESMEENYDFLVRGLAHELKNPLSGIKGAAQLLNKNLNEDEIVRCSEIIIKEVDRLRDLIERIKRIDTFDKGSFSPVDIHELLFDIIFLESKTSKNIEFSHNFDITMPPVIADKNSLKQVLINIIKNSVDAIKNSECENGGHVTLGTKWVTDYKIKSKNSVIISVKDNGTGIDRKNVRKIFTPFFSSKEKGSGLGLFISNQIIIKHGGFITVESEPGTGTEFQIHLPTDK